MRPGSDVVMLSFVRLFLMSSTPIAPPRTSYVSVILSAIQLELTDSFLSDWNPSSALWHFLHAAGYQLAIFQQ